MKAKLSLFRLILALLVFLPVSGRASYVWGHFFNGDGSDYTGVVQFSPNSNPQAIGTNTVVGSSFQTNFTSYPFTNTFEPGNWTVKIGKVSSFNINVPNDTNVYNINTLATNLPTFAISNFATIYGTVVSTNDTTPGFLAAKLLPGTNIVFVTNSPTGNASITINAAGGANIDASNIVSGTLNTNRLSAALRPLSANNGASLTNINPGSPVVPPAGSFYAALSPFLGDIGTYSVGPITLPANTDFIFVDTNANSFLINYPTSDTVIPAGQAFNTGSTTSWTIGNSDNIVEPVTAAVIQTNASPVFFGSTVEAPWLDLGTLKGILPTTAGGTGTSDPSGFPTLFGVQNIGSFSTGIWTVANTVTPSYIGQPIIGFGGGLNQPANLMIGNGTSAGSISNGLTIPYGINVIGNPSYMKSGTFSFLEIYTAGNPIDQTNINLDQGARLWCTSDHSSGAAWTCTWTGTNASFGSVQTWAGWPTTSITNANGEIVYCHDNVADAFMCVPDGALEVDSPNQSIWVCNSFGHLGDTNVQALQSIMVNTPGGGLTPANYPALTINSLKASIDLGWFQDKAYTYRSNNYKASLSADLFTGLVHIPNTLLVSNFLVTNNFTANTNATVGGILTSTNGFASTATNTFTVTTTGTTNNSAHSQRLLGMVGVSVVFSNSASHLTVSLGTITVPQIFLLNLGESLSAASAFAVSTNIAQ